MFPRVSTRSWFRLTVTAAVAGLLYCSWPLGYSLDPIANEGLASNLQAAGQPYSWLFVALDIASGLLICLVAWKLYRRLVNRSHSRWLVAAIVGFGIFGILTMVDAVLPIDCIAPAHTCKPIFEDPYFIIHGVASVGSIYGLTVSIVCLWWLLIRDQRIGTAFRYLLHSTMVVWFGFGLGTADLIYLNKSSALSQHIFIVVCSLWTAAMPYLVRRSLVLQTAVARITDGA